MSPHHQCTHARASALFLVASVFVAAPAFAQSPAPAPAAPAATQAPLRLDVPYVPTPESVVDRMLKMGEVGKDDFVIDLGSGDGRIAIAAVKERGARGAMGVDINPERIKEAKANAEAAGVTDKVTFVQQNLFETDLSKATVITMYLLETVNAKLRPTLLELKPGTRLVSHAFSMGDWAPDQRTTEEGRTVYMWVVPAHVGGRWAFTDGENRFTVDLNQTFQNIGGGATVNGRTVQLRDARLTGDEIVLTLPLGDGAKTYRGKVSDGTIKPVEGDGWSATRS
ncbi:SAM-dependent methyltransferase [Aquabacter spiritensis]|uniref:Methyltransferase family protein n=1 Tax=Aquabacter spiritensis TaxID=933073 RepID=A0A4R3M6D7_9HYPH|nr:class I SAM-dependent methyltransferase [Aquabacter spiritensis]TCT06825.1 methyltransferase family protein [Aquabacter spiritensis]